MESEVATDCYEDRLVAFMDILGWKDVVSRSVNDGRILERINGAIESVFAILSQRALDDDGSETIDRFTHFSDCMVFSTLYRGENDIFRVAREVSLIISLFSSYGLFLRGGVSLGKFIHKSRSVFGPALNEAHDLESKIAIYPRVIFSDELSARIRGAIKEVPSCNRDRHVSEDVDSLLFVDFMRSSTKIHGSNPVRLYLNNYYKNILDGLYCSENCPAVSQKYQWLARYYNQCLDEFPETKLSRISLFQSAPNLKI